MTSRPISHRRQACRLIAGAILCGGMWSSAWAQRGNPSPVFDGQAINALVANFMRDNKVPGLGLAVVQAPYITRVTGFGFSDTGRKLLASSNTMFQIGSLAEAFTAVAVLQLVEQGKVKLDDPIEQHVPLTPDAWHGVTVQQLLLHQSGLPDYSKTTSGTAAPAMAFQAVSDTKPSFEAGTNTAPSATDYLLLQLLIENASGQSYEGFVRANQIDKLGLKHTFFAGELVGLPRDLPAGNEPHSGYLKDPALINPTEPATGYQADLAPLSANEARGTIYASAEDLGTWSLALPGEILIKNPDLRKLLEGPAKLKNGATVAAAGPWLFPENPGEVMAEGHGTGFSTVLCRYMGGKEMLGIVLVANKDGVDLNPLAEQIAAAYDPKIKPSATPTPSPSPTATPKVSPTSTPKASPKAEKK